LVNRARDLDVVVFGATGVTGRHVAAHLDSVGASWAAAGRDPAKLERTLAEVGVAAPATITADLSDSASLAAMASRTAVVLNLAGPYTTRGRPVIQACVDAGAHYADLTGEIPFARRMLLEFEAPAQAAEVKIVQVCGFEALPPDLAVQATAELARERWGEELAEVDLTVAIVEQPPGPPRPSDLISGGTFQSMTEVVGAADAAALIADPIAAEAVRRVSPIALLPRRGRDGAVIGSMTPAAFINPAVIQRTAAITAAERGVALQPFRYREGVALPGSALSAPFRLAAAGALSASQAGMRAAMRARPAIRSTIATGLGSLLPSSGFGPAPDRLEQWRWRLELEARTSGGHELTAEVEASGHPGYLATSRMLAEAGLLLAEDGVTPSRSGYLTPALALGTDGLERFERGGMQFRIG
jgi:short subunit dehydrogenase-like uncharacterized protein